MYFLLGRKHPNLRGTKLAGLQALLRHSPRRTTKSINLEKASRILLLEVQKGEKWRDRLLDLWIARAALEVWQVPLVQSHSKTKAKNLRRRRRQASLPLALDQRGGNLSSGGDLAQRANPQRRMTPLPVLWHKSSSQARVVVLAVEDSSWGNQKEDQSPTFPTTRVVPIDQVGIQMT
jgi:hypothetical protein